MPKILHIITKENDPLAEQVISLQSSQAGHEIKRVDLTVPTADYRVLLEEIFASDSVEVW